MIAFIADSVQVTINVRLCASYGLVYVPILSEPVIIMQKESFYRVASFCVDEPELCNFFLELTKVCLQ